MTLAEVRALFIERSGRFDLVHEDGTDNGANFFILSAVRMLDRMLTHNKTDATHFGAISVGEFKHVFGRCRAIKEVWVSNAVSRTKLELLTPLEFYSCFAAPAMQISSGRPAFYTPINLRATDLDAFESITAFIQHVQVDDASYNGIVFNPADMSYVIEIIGAFESAELLTDAAVNFWTVNFPDILVLACMYKLEVFHRNPTGADGWMQAVATELIQIEMDMVEQDDQLEDMR